MKILIIDDEAIVRRALTRAFQVKSYEVHQAEDGVDGEKQWLQLQPDVVIVDVIMPHQTGPELIEKLQETIKSSKVKVVLMSAFSGGYNTKLAKYKNVDLFIKKPFSNIFELVEKIQGLVHCE